MSKDFSAGKIFLLLNHLAVQRLERQSLLATSESSNMHLKLRNEREDKRLEFYYFE